ncbi:MAG: hypothetical protein ABSA51_03175 [Anaerolineaceae bacterium]|jgi:hypothetical protein
METLEISNNNQISHHLRHKEQLDNLHRIITSALLGAFLFIMFLESFGFWAWYFALPRVPYSSLWLQIYSIPFRDLYLYGIAGLVFGGLVGIPRKWWWSPVIWAGLGAIYSLFGLLNTDYHYSLNDIVLSVCFCILLPCSPVSLLVAGTRLLQWAYSTKKTIGALALLGIISVFIGTEIFLSRQITSPSDSLKLLSIYQYAEANNWQIKSFKVEGLVADSGTGIHITLEDGSTRECIYWDAIAMGYESDYPNGYPESLDLRDVMSCPP